MQSHLGEYPGARGNPGYKFVRAVNSFLLQRHQDKELIIVADECGDTKNLYERCFSYFDNIKFAYVGRGNSLRMRQVRDGKRYFRGLPRQVGRALASGDIITYMDADDLMLPSRLSQLNSAWLQAAPDKIWAYNTMVLQPKTPSFILATDSTIDLRLFGFAITEPVYAGYMAQPGYMIASPPAISHRPSVKSEWKDTWEESDANGNKIYGGSEDAAFVKGRRAEAPGCKHDSPTYVVCHYKGDPSCPGGWDI